MAGVKKEEIGEPLHAAVLRMADDGTMTQEIADSVLAALCHPEVTQAVTPSRNGQRQQRFLPTEVTVKPGLYRKDGQVYLVQPNLAGDRTYALLFTPERTRKPLDMAKGKVYELTPADQIKGKAEIRKLLDSSAKLDAAYQKATARVAA